MEQSFAALEKWNKTMLAPATAVLYFTEGMATYGEEFLKPFLNATQTFANIEAKRFFYRSPEENWQSYTKLLQLNLDLLSRYTTGAVKTLGQYNKLELSRFLSAWHEALMGINGATLGDYFSHQETVLRRVVSEFPQTIKAIEPEYGFHFERYPGSLVHETPRFELRQVFPHDDGVEIDDSLKPIFIIPPFVLGANILAFLPGEKKSYAHSFANRGIPTYIRIMKPIHENEAVQTMTLEDDAEDTRLFCEILSKKHKLPVTLNGYCQGGFSSVCNILSGKLDGLVDALITCVAPMDGTRSKGLGKFLHDLPAEFNDLAYGTKTLANGNLIADGDLMGWIYKLKSIEESGPLIAYFKDIMMLTDRKDRPATINKTVAALNYWLQNERSDLPMSVTEMSFRSYNIPVTANGDLPITMFGKQLNFKGITERNIPWLLCYGIRDDLVEKEVSTAPLDFVDAEVSPFPKGHVAIATSWSHPNSDCPLDGRFGEENFRGPVKFHLDLNEQLRK
jgi:hypothetical protein